MFALLTALMLSLASGTPGMASDCVFYAFKVDPNTGQRAEEANRDSLVGDSPMSIRFDVTGGDRPGMVNYWYSIDDEQWVFYGAAPIGETFRDPTAIVTLTESGRHTLRFACTQRGAPDTFSDEQTVIVEGGGGPSALVWVILIAVGAIVLHRRSQRRQDGKSSIRAAFDGVELIVYRRTPSSGDAATSDAVIGRFKATSGQIGTTPDDQCRPNIGPLPEGRYVIRAQQLQKPPASDLAAWGNWRVPVIPAPGTYLCDPPRGGFYIHGGAEYGSLGCIDLGPNDTPFSLLVRGEKQPIDVTIDYSAWRTALTRPAASR